MKKILIFSIFMLIITRCAFGADIDLKWDTVSGATGYKLQKSIDLGVTWSTAIDVGNVTTFKFLNIEENLLVLFRSSAYNTAGESIRYWSGAWFDNRKKPISAPSGTGIQ